MMSEQLSVTRRVALVVAVLAMGGGVFLTPALGGPWFVALAATGLGIGWRYVPGFWRTILAGLVGGLVAGLVILGPGFRLSMRVVAVLDPVRRPELSFEGTMFIMIFIGVIVGGIFGVLGALLRRVFDWPSRVGAMVIGAMGLSAMIADPGLRGELFELGAGPWVNLPMFGAVFFGYARVADRVSAWFVARRKRAASVMAEV
jgi:MFS family permease